MFCCTLTQMTLKLGKNSLEQIEKFSDVIEEGRQILLYEAFAFWQTASSGELPLPVLQRLSRLDGATATAFLGTDCSTDVRPNCRPAGRGLDFARGGRRFGRRNLFVVEL